MKKIYLLATAALMTTFTSCDLDINENPNYPSSSDVTPDLIFPAVENAIADVSGDHLFNYAGFFAQYFEQMPEANQYNDYCTYNIDEESDLFNRPYRLIYAGALQDIKDITSRTDNTANLFACAVMRAQAFQLVVDNIGEAPYSEALQGSENAQPKFDEGKAIYEGVLAEIDEAEAALESSDVLTLTDPMLNGNMNQWRGYANALRLRMYLRLIDAGEASYTSKVQALVSANNFFNGDIAWNVYSNAEGQYNPWYASKFRLGTNNHVAAYPIVSYYVATNDPRVAYAIKTTEATGEYEGQLPGSKTKGSEWVGANWKNADVSGIDYTPSVSMPVYMFTQSELQFLIAEVELRFNNNAAAAKTAYEAAVAADFSSRGIAGVETFLAGAKVNFDAQASNQAKLNLIYQQKWAALFYRDHMEAWSEARRTGVPAQSAATAKAIYSDATVYTPGDFIEPAQNYITNGGLIKCIPYPSDARRLNKNMPEHVRQLDEKVFFGK